METTKGAPKPAVPARRGAKRGRLPSTQGAGRGRAVNQPEPTTPRGSTSTGRRANNTDISDDLGRQDFTADHDNTPPEYPDKLENYQDATDDQTIDQNESGDQDLDLVSVEGKEEEPKDSLPQLPQDAQSKKQLTNIQEEGEEGSSPRGEVLKGANTHPPPPIPETARSESGSNAPIEEEDISVDLPGDTPRPGTDGNTEVEAEMGAREDAHLYGDAGDAADSGVGSGHLSGGEDDASGGVPHTRGQMMTKSSENGPRKAFSGKSTLNER